MKKKYIISVKIPVEIFEDSEKIIVNAPELDIAGYGNTEVEALESFQIVFNEYLKFLKPN